MHSDEKNDDSPTTDGEILRGRPFDLSEAIGRAGAGNLKGASPVARAQQVLLEIRGVLETRLHDPEGSLTRTILARLEADVPLLARHFEHPTGAIVAFLDRVLSVPLELASLVRDADARWGRDYGEKPHFEPDGGDAAPDDPYTEAGVRQLLAELRRRL